MFHSFEIFHQFLERRFSLPFLPNLPSAFRKKTMCTFEIFYQFSERRLSLPFLPNIPSTFRKKTMCSIPSKYSINFQKEDSVFPSFQTFHQVLERRPSLPFIPNLPSNHVDLGYQFWDTGLKNWITGRPFMWSKRFVKRTMLCIRAKGL